ncbi:PmoA family protein [Akkermansiaceae bacterium]|nr:PmoA family protein [Akkermansiaceae bacterium]
MIRLLSPLLLAISTPLMAADNLRLDHDSKAGLITVRRGDSTILTQVAGPTTRPYLHPIIAPDGKGALTEFSPGHHKHQTGLYWGFTRVNGRDHFHNLQSDYWKRNSAKIIERSGSSVSWQTSYDLLDVKGQAVLTQTQTWLMSSSNEEHTLDLTWKGKANTDVTIGKWKYGGLFLRMPWHKGETKGEVVNSALQKNGQAEGKRAVWVDVGMDIEGRDDWGHIAIFDHPKNSDFPQPWRVDGQLGIGPSRAILGDWKIPKNETETIRHRFIIHTGKLDSKALTKKWEDYSKVPYRDVTFITTPAKPVPLIDLNQARLESIVEMDREQAFSLLFTQLAVTDNSAIQKPLLKGILLGLDGQRNLTPPPNWFRLRTSLLDQKDPQLDKLVDQLSQIFGDLSVSQDALKLVLNGDASLEDRKEALSGLVAMRFQELPKNLNALLDSSLKVDAIRAYSLFNYPEAPKELISKYENFDTVGKRETLDTLASKLSYAKALLEALRTGKITKTEIPNYTARNLQKMLGGSFDKVFGKILEMGELSEISKNPVNPLPDGFTNARRIEVGVLAGLKFNTDRIEAKAGEKIVFVFPNDDSSGMTHNLAIITPGSRQTVLDAAVAMGAAGLKKNFIPEIPELLASTPQVAQGMKYTLYFAVPEEPGNYHFICTYPGHGLIMQGIFAVQ